MRHVKEMIINLFRKITENLDIAWLVGLLLAALICVSEKGSDSAIREISRLQKRIADLEAEVLRLQAALEEKNREIYELEGERD